MQFLTGEAGINTRNNTMYFVSLALLVASLPLSKFTMSVFQFTTLIFWLWHGVDTAFLHKYSLQSLLNPLKVLALVAETLVQISIAFGEKLARFFRNKPALIITSLILLHVIGLFYTTDFGYALKDLRTKLPILILPLFLATGPRLDTVTFYRVLALFIAAVFAGSIYRLILFVNTPVADSRDVEVHTSHIRYSLNAVFAIFILIFFAFKYGKLPAGQRIAAMITATWLAAFMVYMNYTTGVLLMVIIGFIMLIFYSFRIKKLRWKIATLSGIAFALLLPLVYIFSVSYQYLHTPKVDFTKLDKYTPAGNSYYHDTLNFKSKNGQWIGLYICDKELRQAWAQRSNLPIDGLDKNKQVIRATLITYLASKGYRKDAEGIKSLSGEDIRNIENGINRFDYKNLPGIQSQVEDFIAGYQHYTRNHDPNAGSMIQRFEYWRTSLLLIGQHPVFGVGTGDLPQAFEAQYNKMNSNLAPQFRLRSHNQYLSITVGLGIFGLLWFLVVMVYPGIKTRNFNNYFYVIFWLIVMISMFTEDTIENQEGVTFYAVFTAMMILGREETEADELLYD
jgi:hypothetical protein